MLLVSPYASCCVGTTNKSWLIDWHTSLNKQRNYNKSVVYETIVFASTSQAMLQLLIAVFLVLPYASCCVDTTNKWWLIDWHTSPNRHTCHNKSVVGLNQKRGYWVCSGVVVVVRVLLDLSDTHGFVCSPSYLRLKAVHKRWMCNVGLVQRSHDYIWRFICCFVLSILTMFIRHES